MEAAKLRSNSMKRWACREISDAQVRRGGMPLAPHERDDRPLSEVLEELARLRREAPGPSTGLRAGTRGRDIGCEHRSERKEV